jgi:HK97 family phage major capsid protein
MSVEQKIDTVFQTEDGKTIDIGAIVEQSLKSGLKDFGFPMGEDGKFNSKGLAVEVKDEKSKALEAYDIGANFIKSMVLPTQMHAQNGVKAIDTTSGSFGSVVPTEIYNEIIAQSARWTIIREYAFVFQMSGKLTVPKDGTAVTAYWVTENSAVTESTPTTGTVTLDDFGVAALVKVSWKLLNTSSQNIVQYIARLGARAITDKEESAFVSGDGTGKPKGITTETITSIAQAGANLTYADIVALYFALPAGFRNNAQFLTSGKGIQLMLKLADTAGRPLFPIATDIGNLFNKPLLESEDIAVNLGTGTNETEIYFGDLSNYWIKDGSGIEMATQDQPENLQTKVVIYKYVDGRCVNTTAFRKLTGVK